MTKPFSLGKASSGLEKLPVELHDFIAIHLSVEDFKALARSNKNISGIYNRWMPASVLSAHLRDNAIGHPNQRKSARLSERDLKRLPHEISKEMSVQSLTDYILYSKDLPTFDARLKNIDLMIKTKNSVRSFKTILESMKTVNSPMREGSRIRFHSPVNRSTVMKCLIKASKDNIEAGTYRIVSKDEISDVLKSIMKEIKHLPHEHQQIPIAALLENPSILNGGILGNDIFEENVKTFGSEIMKLPTKLRGKPLNFLLTAIQRNGRIGEDVSSSSLDHESLWNSIIEMKPEERSGIMLPAFQVLISKHQMEDIEPHDIARSAHRENATELEESKTISVIDRWMPHFIDQIEVNKNTQEFTSFSNIISTLSAKSYTYMLDECIKKFPGKSAFHFLKAISSPIHSAAIVPYSMLHENARDREFNFILHTVYRLAKHLDKKQNSEVTEAICQRYYQHPDKPCVAGTGRKGAFINDDEVKKPMAAVILDWGK